MKKILAALLSIALALGGCHAAYAQAVITTTASNQPTIGLGSGITGVLSPANGGTGVANASTQTLTRVGAHALTITTTGTTGITLPTSGTLARISGETFTTPTLGVATATSINFGGTALANYVEGSFTPTANSFTVVGSPTYTASYTRVGRMVYLYIRADSSTSTASTLGTSNFTGIPVGSARVGICTAASPAGSFTGYSTGLISGTTVYPPAWSANASVVVNCVYEAT